MNISTLNRVWARLILTALHRAGVKDICIAPGSRSSPLTLEAQALSLVDKQVTLHTHFDERGLGFLALGLAKSSDKPVAVIVTSGTAVANLLPGVCESALTREKLVLLTADRPLEFIACGANQAINQRHIFGEHAPLVCDLPSPCEKISPAWLLCTLDEKIHKQKSEGGSVHINCPFPEPLYGPMEDTSTYLAPVQKWLEGEGAFLKFNENAPNLSFLKTAWLRLQHQKGVIIAGKMDRADRQALEALAETLGWPLLCDPQAGKASDFAGFDVWLQNKACHAFLSQAQCMVQFGGRLVSKRLGQFIEGFQGEYCLVDLHPGRLDPFHLPAARIVAKPEAVANALTTLTTQLKTAVNEKNWANALSKASAHYFSMLKDTTADALTEMAVATDFSDWILDKTDLFLGNSLSIRLLDMCCRFGDLRVFANRGASGIDGLIATACGVQRGRKKPMVCLLGDISALYDLNSLALLAQAPFPFVLIVLNNDGGGIFDLLPVPKKSKDLFYRMPHGLDFAHAAGMFGLNYRSPQTLLEAKNACIDAQKQPLTTLIELRFPAGESGLQIHSLVDDITHASLF